MASFSATSQGTKARQNRKGPSLSKLIVDGKTDEEEGGELEVAGPTEEFDFSEVFGAVATEGGSSPTWPPGGVREIATGTSPARILTRSHSLVGPSPRPSIDIIRAFPPSSFDSRRRSHLQEKENTSRRCSKNGTTLSISVSPPRISISSSDDDGNREEDGSSTSAPLDLLPLNATNQVEPFDRETVTTTTPRSGRDHCDGGKGRMENEDVRANENEDVDDDVCPTKSKKIGPHDFKLLRVVGQGAFGKVFQVQEIETHDIYAMKVMRKEGIMEKNHAEYMKAERDILTKIVHPFIVQLRYSFQTKSKLYLVLDFINGGHLFFQLYRQGTFSEELARIYTAEIVSAVAHLHNNGIIHRDLKPENILLDAEGHVKLTDFGLAKEIDDSRPTNSMCGTIEYMAPEIVLATGHGKAADWWSVGILLFEMLTGKPPFTHNNRQKLQQKIVKDKIKLPSYLTSEAHSLLKGLLQKDPEKRLGNGSHGSDDLKQHKWFRPINWKKLEAREVIPKFIPEVNGQDCIANFDERWTKMPPQDSPASTPRAHQMGLFDGYTYVAPNRWLTLIEKPNS